MTRETIAREWSGIESIIEFREQKYMIERVKEMEEETAKGLDKRQEEAIEEFTERGEH